MKSERETMWGGDARAELQTRAAAIHRAAKRVFRSRRGANTGAVAIAVFMALGALDAAWAAPVWLRLGFAGALYAAVVLAAVRSLTIGRKDYWSVADAVGAAERRALGEEGAARSAVELAETPTRDGVSQAMVDRVIAQGVVRLRSLDVSHAIDRAPLRKALIRLAAILSVFAVVSVTLPRLVWTEATRLFDPLGDHPVYSMVRVSIESDTEDFRVGDDLHVRLVVERSPIEAATLGVQWTNGEVEHIAMSPRQANDGSSVFEATLLDVRSPVQIRGDAGRAQTRWMKIVPEVRPRLRDATVTLTPPPYLSGEGRTYEMPLEGVPVVFEGYEVRVEARTSIEIAEVKTQRAVESRVDGRSVTVTWDALKLGRMQWSLDLFGAAGLGLDEPIRVEVEVVADEPPVIEVLAPRFGGPDGDQALAVPTSVVQVRAEAIDDVLVTSFVAQWRLRRGGADQSEWREFAAAMSPHGKAMRLRGAFSLAEFGARIGDRFEVRFKATDERKSIPGGGGVTVMGPFIVDIISPESMSELAPIGSELVIPADGDAASDAVDRVAGGEAGNTETNQSASEGEPQESGAGEIGGSTGGESGHSSTGDASSETETRGKGNRTAKDDAAADGAEATLNVEEHAASAGDMSAIGWATDWNAMAPLLDPVLLNRLPRRARDVIARYYELMAASEE